MRRVSPLFAVLLVGFAPAPVYKPKSLADDLKAMQGEWDCVSRTSGGRPVDNLVEKVHIRGDRLTYIGQAGSFRRTLTLTLADYGPPRRFDSKYEPSPKESETFLGVYSIRGDTLSMCYTNSFSGLARPSDITPNLVGVNVDILRRRKP